jgi:spore coat polysaccharide biosynthesis protein SpsF (cytidylyltransferase family)
MYFGFITVRASSKRLPKKCFKKLNNITVIDHCILRAKSCKITPILCTTKNPADRILMKYAKKNRIRIFRGSEKNKIKRWYDCANYFNIKKFHTIDADDPYFDTNAIKKSIKELNQKYNIILPSKVSRKGGASEGYSFSKIGIYHLYKSLFDYKFKNFENFDTEMIDGFIKKLKIKKKIFMGTKYEIKKDIRLTLDYKADYDLIKKISKKFHYSTSRFEINKFLNNNKNLLNINFFLNKKWKNKQNKFKIPQLKK